jgi:hypothetical protein
VLTTARTWVVALGAVRFGLVFAFILPAICGATFSYLPLVDIAEENRRSAVVQPAFARAIWLAGDAMRDLFKRTIFGCAIGDARVSCSAQGGGRRVFDKLSILVAENPWGLDVKTLAAHVAVVVVSALGSTAALEQSFPAASEAD